MLGLFSISLMLLSGCDLIDMFGSGSGASKSGAKKQAKANAAKAAKKSNLITGEEEEYAYNPIGKRDPFRSFLSITAPGTEDNIPRTPLQKYDIEQYRLTGIVWGIDRPRAMVEDPDGVGHPMELGTYIGKNWGKVTAIRENLVVITEEFQTVDGELVVKPIELRLRYGETSSSEF